LKTPSPLPFFGTLPIVIKKSKRKAGKLAGNFEPLLYIQKRDYFALLKRLCLSVYLMEKLG
jgi:hypothetical protein